MLAAPDAPGARKGDSGLSCRAIQRDARFPPDRLHPYHAGDALARQRQAFPQSGAARRGGAGSVLAHRRRRLSAEGGAARSEEPLGHRQQRADAASKRRPCALLDRAGPAEGNAKTAAALIVIPGARSASPESITTIGGYGFRACAQEGASRNDGLVWPESREIRRSNRCDDLR